MVTVVIVIVALVIVIAITIVTVGPRQSHNTTAVQVPNGHQGLHPRKT